MHFNATAVLPTTAIEGQNVITTIVHFSMPKANIDEFLETWTTIKTFMLTQPGALDGTMHRSIDEDSPFALVNVAHWDSANALADALRASSNELKEQGTDLSELFERLSIDVSQNNYIVEVSYGSRNDAARSD